MNNKLIVTAVIALVVGCTVGLAVSEAVDDDLSNTEQEVISECITDAGNNICANQSTIEYCLDSNGDTILAGCLFE